jgi:hypothetical protein
MLTADPRRSPGQAGRCLCAYQVAYQQNPTRYEYRLTEKGLDLHPVLMAIVHWGDVHMAGKKGRPLLHTHTRCRHQFDPLMVCSECHAPLEPREVRVSPGPGARGRHSMATAGEPSRRRAGKSAKAKA